MDASDTRILASADLPRLYALGQNALTFGWARFILPLACVVSIAVAGLRTPRPHPPAKGRSPSPPGMLFAECALANLAYIFHVLPVPGLMFPLLYPSSTLMAGFLPTGLALYLAVGSRRANKPRRPGSPM